MRVIGWALIAGMLASACGDDTVAGGDADDGRARDDGGSEAGDDGAGEAGDDGTIESGDDGAGEAGDDGGGDASCANHCANTVQDCGETAMDCGGECCPCADGTACSVARDCVSGSCQGGSCRPVSCTDGLKNGQECGIDCGGPCPTACATEQVLLDAFDGEPVCAEPDCRREVQGGSPATGGWSPTDGDSRVIYDFGRPIDCGRLTVTVDNFDPWNQFQPRDIADPYTEFLSLFDGLEDNPGDRFNHYSDYSQIDVVYPPACFDPLDPSCTPNYTQIKPNAGLLTACDWDSGRYCGACLQAGTTSYVFELEWTVQGLTMRVNGADETYYPYPVYPNTSCTFLCRPKTPELRYLYVGRPAMDWQGFLVGPVYRRVELIATVE